MKSVRLALAIAAVALGQGGPWTEQYLEEAAAANKTCAAKDLAGCRDHLLKLKDLADGRGDVIYRLARVEASLGHRPAAMEYLELYSGMGLHLADPDAEEAFAAWKDSPDFQAILARLKAATAPVTRSQVFATLPEKDLLPEDIAYDPATGRFFLSSVRHHKIVVLRKDGTFANFVPEGEHPMMALAADARRRRLWATTVDDGKSALLLFHLDSAKLLRRFDLPAAEKHELGDMTLSPSGDLYISDSLGSLYFVDHTRDRLELLFGPGAFRSPQTPALSSDGRRLFVPDYSRGISIVDVAARTWKLLPHPPGLSLGGIDGMYLAGRTLVAIQNGTAPARLIRMNLDAGLTRIVSWETLEANWSGLGDATHGVRVGDQFYFIANSGWDVKPGGTFEPAIIRRMTWK
jgi:hypothetical protein